MEHQEVVREEEEEEEKEEKEKEEEGDGWRRSVGWRK